MAKDLADFNGYKVLRLYGTDCNQVSNVLKATKHAVSIFAGIQDIGNVDSEVETLASAVNGNWKLIIAVGVGNELVNGHKASVDEYVFPDLHVHIPRAHMIKCCVAQNKSPL